MSDVRHRSLRFRLLVASGISIGLALLITGASLLVMFEHHVERRIGQELETYLNQITANIEVSENGRVSFDLPLADPRFNQPLSGLYWQIQDMVRPTLLRSRSLWDSKIELPEDQLASGEIHRHVLAGPAGQMLLIRERHITLLVVDEIRRLRLAVALDRNSLYLARNAFVADMLPYLAIMVVVLLLAAWIQVRIGLSPLDALRRGVMKVRKEGETGLERVYPDEVMPLVNELNALLSAQEQSIERARAWTADLAHGLKTPLTVLTSEAQRLRDEGGEDLAESLEELAENMRRRVDRELIRARLLSGVQSSPVEAQCGQIIEGIVRTLKKIPGSESINWEIHLTGDTRVMMASGDVTELLGNLLENATKWAKSNIRVSLRQGEMLQIRIEDDGPGVQQDQLENISQRGVRLDEKTRGSGLGLAIALDIVEAYHGSLSFAPSLLGGLAVRIDLPVPQVPA